MGLTDDALALAFRTGLPYVGLRDHAHDPELDDLIPPDAARAARVLPLVADDDRIRLAVADPEPDLASLDPYLSGRRVELALAPREELDEILGPPPRVTERAADEPVSVVAGPEEEAGSPPAPDAGPGDEEGSAGEAAGGAEAGPAGAVEADLPPAPDAGPAADEEEAAGDEEASGGAELAAEDAAVERGMPEAPAAALATGAAASPPADDHPELAGEVPSWLEPRRRRWRVVLMVIIVLLVLIAAAAAVYAYLNA